ncbi:MAG TPA: hypothetical protein VFY23_09140 [Candidatus Limnocylindrales bacterium]|nr:hypothetical protein [Candidatus Limnocylindrales bacterium]
MSSPDRTDELIGAMLERRTGGGAPPWLAARVGQAVGATPQRPAGRGWSPTGTKGRLALLAAAVLIMVAAAGAALAIGMFSDETVKVAPPSAVPSLTVPTPGASLGPGASASAASESETAPTTTAAAGALPVDSIAVVTRAGRNLRVRTAPGLGDDSEKLEPVLPAGTRMLVVGDPVKADDYVWYPVHVPDEALTGWVASADHDGRKWLRRVKAECPDHLDADGLGAIPTIDLMLCFRDEPIPVEVLGVIPPDRDDAGCWNGPEDPACQWRPPLFGRQVELFLGADTGSVHEAGSDLAGVVTRTAVVSPAVPRSLVDAGSRGALVTLSFDHPEARECRVRDGSRDLVDPWIAAVECRLMPVVEDVQPIADENDEGTGPVPGTIAWAATDVAIRDAAGNEIGRLQEGDPVYLDAAVPDPSAPERFAVLPNNGQYPVYGWIPAAAEGGSTLFEATMDCPQPEDWTGFVHMSRLERLACFEDEPLRFDAWVRVMQDPEPTWSDGCTAWSYHPAMSPAVPCQAVPEWLATFSGVVIRRPGDMEEEVPLGPGIDRAQLPTSETWMQVTATYGADASDECRVIDPSSGSDLLPREQAEIYCRARLLVTGLGPATTSP